MIQTFKQADNIFDFRTAVLVLYAPSYLPEVKPSRHL